MFVYYFVLGVRSASGIGRIVEEAFVENALHVALSLGEHVGGIRETDGGMHGLNLSLRNGRCRRSGTVLSRIEASCLRKAIGGGKRGGRERLACSRRIVTL